MPTVIKTTNLCYRSGKRFLLNHINWEVEKGDHWLIFGMNGSGKTTLLSTIAGFLPITEGELFVLNQQYNAMNIFSLRKKIGWVSSSFFDKYYTKESALQIVLSGLSGTFNIDFAITDFEVRQAKALLRELNLGEKINQPFCFMSKGERQNVLIARALITSPEILVLDEPGTGLDIYARKHMMNTVKELAESGKVTILYVTHYPEEIQSFMNKTLLMRNGRIFAQGDSNKILTEENISALLNAPVELQKNADGTMSMSVSAISHIFQLCYERQGF